MIISRSILLRMRNVSDEKIKTHTSYEKTFFPENRAVYEITWKNMVQSNRPQMTTWRLRVACRYLRQETHTQNTHTYYFSAIAMAARTRPKCYVVRTSLVIIQTECFLRGKDSILIYNSD
jgi:hypothetical protein